MRAARMPMLVPNAALTGIVTQFCLAREEVCYVGEPMALVVAESRAIAEDGVAALIVDAEPVPAAGDCRAAVAPGAQHEDRHDNQHRHGHDPPRDRQPAPSCGTRCHRRRRGVRFVRLPDMLRQPAIQFVRVGRRMAPFLGLMAVDGDVGPGGPPLDRADVNLEVGGNGFP
jgi:hypothetical protein